MKLYIKKLYIYTLYQNTFSILVTKFLRFKNKLVQAFLNIKMSGL